MLAYGSPPVKNPEKPKLNRRMWLQRRIFHQRNLIVLIIKLEYTPEQTNRQTQIYFELWEALKNEPKTSEKIQAGKTGATAGNRQTLKTDTPGKRV